MTSRRSGAHAEILAATTYAAIDTWYECDETVYLYENGDQIRLTVHVTGEPGEVCFKSQVKDLSGTWVDMLGPGAPWCNRRLRDGDSIHVPLNSAGFCAGDEVKILYRASAGAGSATIAVEALAHDSRMHNGAILEQSGGLPVILQDQTTPPIDALFSQSISNFTLAADATVSTVTVLNYSFTATTGHGIIIGDELLLLDVLADRSLQCEVINVVGDVITIDRPIDHAYSAAGTLGRIVTTQLAVTGSLASPQIFSIRAGETPSDHVRFIITMLDDTSMDDGRFGGGTALTNGLVLRIVNSYQKTIFNFKTNGDIRQFCYDTDYLSKAPAGQYGLGARITFGSQGKHGVVLRISTGDVIQWVVQDDLSGLISLKIAAEGHDTTD